MGVRSPPTYWDWGYFLHYNISPSFIILYCAPSLKQFPLHLCWELLWKVGAENCWKKSQKHISIAICEIDIFVSVCLLYWIKILAQGMQLLTYIQKYIPSLSFLTNKVYVTWMIYYGNYSKAFLQFDLLTFCMLLHFYSVILKTFTKLYSTHNLKCYNMILYIQSIQLHNLTEGPHKSWAHLNQDDLMWTFFVHGRSLSPNKKM